MDNEVNGVTVLSTVGPEREVYTLCDGTDSGGVVTTEAPCPGRDVMYGAYFDAAGLPVETNVDVLGEVHRLPIRLGEISTYK